MKALVLFGDLVIAKGSNVRANFAVGPMQRQCVRPRDNLLRMRCNFSEVPQNRLDFTDKQSVHAQGRPRPF
jgi:hypothetical protein